MFPLCWSIGVKIRRKSTNRASLTWGEEWLYFNICAWIWNFHDSFRTNSETQWCEWERLQKCGLIVKKCTKVPTWEPKPVLKCPHGSQNTRKRVLLETKIYPKASSWEQEHMLMCHLWSQTYSKVSSWGQNTLKQPLGGQKHTWKCHLRRKMRA